MCYSKHTPKQLPMTKPTLQPTIKGLFVNSHLKFLKKQKGQEAVLELQRRVGKPLKFGNLQNVPVEDEIKIIDCIVDILQGDMPAQKRAYEAGRLHFRNFLRTSVAKFIYAQSKVSPKLVFLMAGKIAAQIFKGLEFQSEGIGKQTVKITIKQNPYPLEHFQGFFQEWLSALGYLGTVTAEQTESAVSEY